MIAPKLYMKFQVIGLKEYY